MVGIEMGRNGEGWWECPWHGFPPQSLPERLAKAMRYALAFESHSYLIRRSQNGECGMLAQ